jgi:hypothetical protein
MVQELHLDIKDVDDKNLLQFETVVYSKIIDYYEKLAADPNHQWDWWDLNYAAEGIMKANDVYERWRAKTGEQSRYWLIEFIRRFAAAVIQVVRER